MSTLKITSASESDPPNLPAAVVSRRPFEFHANESRTAFPRSPIVRRLKGDCPTCGGVIRAWVRHGEIEMHHCDICQSSVVPRWTHFVAGGKEFAWISQGASADATPQAKTHPCCACCGLTRGSLMFREYEAGTEWSGNACCGGL